MTSGGNVDEYGPAPPVIRTLPLVSKVAVCPDRGVDMLPVVVNVFGDCANAIETWPATSSKRSARTALGFISHLQSSENVEPGAAAVGRPDVARRSSPATLD